MGIKIGSTAVVLVFLSLMNPVFALPVALVYLGPGSCVDGCSEAAAEVALKSGFQVKFVKPDALDKNSTSKDVMNVFADADVWLQPGGIANEAYYSMTPRLRKELRNFVETGGGYVGFCAGAFMATQRIGGTRDSGLGIFPGGTYPFGYWPVNRNVTFSFEAISWIDKLRSIYFEGGPYMYGILDNPAVEKIAYFKSGHIAAARTTFGLGRVFITGAHPEAPTSWSEEENVPMPGGDSHDLAVSMVKWAGKSRN